MAKMGRYIAGRLVQGLVTLLIVTSIIFILFEAMPGDPIDKFRANPTTTAADIARLEHLYGLDDPVYVRYFRFLGNMFTLQFGDSYSKGAPVLDLI